jgi:hypothetical protein
MTQNGLYGYDAENRLVSLSGTATYTYDADGQRGQANVLYWAGPSIMTSERALLRLTDLSPPLGG